MVPTYRRGWWASSSWHLSLSTLASNKTATSLHPTPFFPTILPSAGNYPSTSLLLRGSGKLSKTIFSARLLIATMNPLFSNAPAPGWSKGNSERPGHLTWLYLAELCLFRPQLLSCLFIPSMFSPGTWEREVKKGVSTPCLSVSQLPSWSFKYFPQQEKSLEEGGY